MELAAAVWAAIGKKKAEMRELKRRLAARIGWAERRPQRGPKPRGLSNRLIGGGIVCGPNNGGPEINAKSQFKLGKGKMGRKKA